MKTILKTTLLFLITAFFLMGCASGPKYSEISNTFQEAPEDTGRIFIYRTAVLGAAIQPDVKLDGEVVGKAVPNGFFFVDKKPGNHKIATSTEVDRHLSLTVEKGQTRFVRLDVSMGFFVGHVYPKLVENNIGEKEIQKCSYTEK